jgi:hypothetical protein
VGTKGTFLAVDYEQLAFGNSFEKRSELKLEPDLSSSEGNADGHGASANV